jgi:cation diffusion facilitator CzcD-associated flavoprotein CzcO
MRIGIVGAGLGGLTTAKLLKQTGHHVTVFDRTPDVGGVWSRTRRYPGLTTQSPRNTYSISDFAMPKHYPEYPTGAQVQEYLAAYAGEFGIDADLRLNAEVVSARTDDVSGVWSLRVCDTRTGAYTAESFDRLVIANGTFCEPSMPEFEGIEEFVAAGGRICAATEFHDIKGARDQHVLVVGYGKSACDVAVPISEVAASTDVIARQLVWKIPKKLGGIVGYKRLLLTRLGEALSRYIRLRRVDRFIHGPGDGVRHRLLSWVGSDYTRQFKLEKLGLVPPGTIADIFHGASGTTTDGFFSAVEAGTIAVHREITIARLFAESGRPYAELSDGSALPADLVVCATGFTQGVSFLDPAILARLLDERDNFMLYRQILPIDVPNLYFNGYNSSFVSTLNAEMAAVWIAAHLAGAVPVPEPAAMRQAVIEQLAFMDRTTGGHHCRGTKIIPFSLHNVDEVLDDLGLNISARVRALHWIIPMNTAAYRNVARTLVERLAPPGESAAPQSGRVDHLAWQ